MFQARSESGIEGSGGRMPPAGLGCENPPRSVLNPPPNGRRRAGQLPAVIRIRVGRRPLRRQQRWYRGSADFRPLRAKVFSFWEP